MTIKIHVTEDIIKKAMFCGTENNKEDVPMSCAIALAIRDIFPNAKVRSCYVSVSDAKWSYLGNFTLPDRAKLFIADFDSRTPQQRLKLHPISFDVDVSDKIIKAIGITEVERILSESKTLERV